ncbi:MAG: hypothetical protein NZ561_07895 [Phycisphaerae bacterium]|nr:hypothetical protein [Phycisphaerae bacterium]MDW8261344.1 hypothetical protein [Phycisphaerales bacterium]
MSVIQGSHSPSSVIDQVAALGPGRERMWPSLGWTRHLSTIAVLLLLTILSTSNTLTQRYVIMDRSGFTLDSRYIIELDPRSRALQWHDRIDLQKALFTRTAAAVQADLLFQRPADYAAFASEAKRLADPAQVSDFGFWNYFSKDYWWPKGISGLYRPLTSVTYWWNFAPIRAIPPAKWEQMYKDDPEGYYRIHARSLQRFHWTNTILHALAATITYFLALALVHRYWVAAFTGAIFSTHPITVESVANIIGRADILAAIFVFLTLLLYIRSTKVQGIRRVPWVAAAVLMMAIGVFCKESALAAGPVVVVYELVYRYRPQIPGLFAALKQWWLQRATSDDGARTGLLARMRSFPLNRTFHDATVLTGDFIGACIRFGVRGWVWFLLPVVLVFAVRAWVFANSTPPEEPFLDNPIRGHPQFGLNESPVLALIESRVTALKVAILLLWKMIFPAVLCSDYSFNEIAIFNSNFQNPLKDLGALLAALLAIAIVLLGFWLWMTGRRAGAFAILFYAVAFLPTANIIRIIGSIMAERFMYLPLFGFALGLTLLTFTAADRWLRVDGASPLRLLPRIVLSVLVCVYGVRTFFRNLVWRSDELLWENAIAISTNSFRSYQSYAFALYENGRIDLERKDRPVRDLRASREALKKLIDDPATPADRRDQARTQLAAVEAALPAAEGALAEQTRKYMQTVQKMIDVDEAGLGIVDNLPHVMNSARLYLHLGMYYAEMGRLVQEQSGQSQLTPEAREWYQKSVNILQRAIPIDRAFNQLNRRKEVVRWKPINEIPDAGLAPVYLILGDSQIRLGLLDEAVETFRYVQQLDPLSSVSYLQLGAIRLSQQRIDDAISFLIQTIILEPTRPEPWPLLINVYQAMGTPDAVLINGEQRQINASLPLVKQHVRTAMRDLIRTMLRARQFDFARTLRKQAIDVHGAVPGTIDVLFEEAGVPIVPPVPVPVDWRVRLDTAKAALKKDLLNR